MRIAAVSGVCDPRSLVPGREPTGTAAQLSGTVHGLAAAGFDVVVHGPDRGHDATGGPGAVLADPVPTGDVDVDDATDARLAASGIDRFAAALARRWRSSRPELVHAHDWFAGAAAARAMRADRASRVPLVVTLPALAHVHRRHLGETPFSAPVRLALERELARTADLLLATSVDQHRELLALGAHRDRTLTVPDGVDGSRFTAPRARNAEANADVRLATVSDLAPHRDTESLIAALARIPRASLTIIGGPPPARLAADPRVAELRSLAVRHDVLDRVRLTGRVTHDRVPALLGAADVVVQIPWFTGSGRAAAEALACGRPVVASAVGGMLETVEHGVNGILVPARDPHALQDALRRLVDDARRRAVLASGARARTLDRFGWPRVTEALVAAYDHVTTPVSDVGEGPVGSERIEVAT